MYKQFSGNPVLKGVDISLKAGEVYAVVGGNGAGKSTLMKIITGLYKPDSGVMKIRGQQASFSNTNDAHIHGIYLVPQEPLIFPNMTVEENITIGLLEDSATLRKKMDAIIKRLGWKLNLQKNAHSLAIAEQQLVEIIRGLVREAGILILDEPTSTLTFGEIESLFKTIRQLTSEGIGVFYITHRFPEIFTLADHVAVLRDGVISAQGPIAEFSYERLIEGLVPENSSVDHSFIEEEKSAFIRNDSIRPALEVSKLSGRRFTNISFQIYPGEILGIAGVVGAGRTELAETVFGLASIEEGAVYLGEKKINKLSVRERIANGLVYVPEDRHTHGIFSITSIKKNITSTILHRLQGLFLPFREEKEISLQYVADLKIKTTSIDQELKNLSGGNQQKVVLSKCLAARPNVIMLDEPTRGIDANARKDIYKIIQRLKSKGIAVLLISSDIEEIQQLSDKVIVMHEGNVVKTLEKSEITIDEITTFAFGVKEEVSV
ncbi:sugar ABC transporter ATP-binding protein [Bacillus sp. FSL K6-3431]|uniref:sugar ABC transporter ATP-binding protein n=1 Tax=Bacillus sp. FSL K6-3431 TaxID=2921500 RepID=UPI0030F802D3